MASMPMAVEPPNDPKGFQFRMAISLGDIIKVVVLCGFGLIGWTTVQNRQQTDEAAQKEQQRELRDLTSREEISAQLNAREAAILDGLEKRVARIEVIQDGKR